MKEISFNLWENLPSVTKSKTNVRIYEDNYILKIADCNLEHLKKLQSKCILKTMPILEIYQLPTENETKILYKSPYYRDFKPFTGKVELNTKEYISFILKLISTVRKMHEENVFSQDLVNSDNLLIDKNFDYRFIDLDSSLVDGVSSLDIYDDLYYSYPEIYKNYPEELDAISQARLMNKIVLLEFLLRGLLLGKINILETLYIEEGMLPSPFEREIFAILEGRRKIDSHDYLEDLIYSLLECNYQSSVLESKNRQFVKIS